MSTYYIKDVTQLIESLAPLAYQESYDNAGLLTGNINTVITSVLIAFDVTEAVVDEAIQKGANLIVAHHPIIFKGLKKLNGNNYVERTIIKAIKNDIAIYAAHTNLDNVVQGVNFKIAEKLGLQHVEILVPKKQLLSKLTAFCPKAHTQQILQALYKAGAGQVGNYQNCSFRTEGTGTFMPNPKAKPFIGQNNIQEEVTEDRIEVIFPFHQESSILKALRVAHPYEEIAYYISSLQNSNQEVGSGAVGLLPAPMKQEEFLKYLKDKMNTGCIKYTEFSNKTIMKVALCGGAGSFLLSNAIKAGADAFVSGDFKYHEFFDAEDKIMIADIGHYESEICTKELFFDFLSEKLANIVVNLSQTKTNPISYF